MSLLGKLFSGLPANNIPTPRPATAQNLESGIEDRFTYELLFPSPEALYNNEFADPLSSSTILAPPTTTAFDYNGDIDLDMRDVRIIIMQEATPTSVNAYLLYDSHAPPPSSPVLERPPQTNGSVFQSRSEGRRSISSPRKASIGQNSRPVVIQQEQTAPRALGAFDRRPNHHKALSYMETEAQRAQREYREEIQMFSNCIWGQSDILAYKGVGTKVHPLASESRYNPTSSSYQNDATGSFGRASMRSSKLAQSYTTDGMAAGPTSAGLSGPGPAPRGDRKKVLITRMFPVPLPSDDLDEPQTQTPTAQSLPNNDTAGYPFPKVHDVNALPSEKKPQPKQKRTPMYAVGMIVHLPATPHAPSAPTSRSSFRGSGSYTEQESFPSSFNSSRRSGWCMPSNGFGVESLDSSFTSDVDDRMDIITPHWDIIMRTLSHLQAVTTTAVLPLLKQADINSPDPRRSSLASQHKRVPSASVSISGKRVVDEMKPFKVPKTNAKLVQLTQGCLSHSQKIQKEVDTSRMRIVHGIKANQVVTGQGRWGIWREQARLVGKWAGSKEEGFFFFNLLTGFLGNHTEWLQALGPSWYRRRHYQQQRSSRDEDISLPARTIIVSDNKMSARRLIFLLAAFLPANQQLPHTRLHRPSTSASFGGYSQSPPNHSVPRLREESLRHKINKRTSTTARSTHSRTASFANQASPVNGLGLSNYMGPEIHHDRRVSDAASIKTANLPIPGSDISTRKSSTAATSTATPVATRTHFSTRRSVRGTGPVPRPGSSGSLATDDLLRSLNRVESTYSTGSTDSQEQNSRWGSMISGFWGSTKRRGSTTTTDASLLSVDGLEINDPHYTGNAPKQRSNLDDMVDEVERTTQAQRLAERVTRKSDSEQTIKGRVRDGTPEQAAKEEVEELPEQIVQAPERVPDPSGAYESPVKTSINEDGVIDIDIPIPDFLAFETAVSSPSSSGYLSTPGFGNGMEGFEHYSRTGPDADTTINVGGWLQRYHPDFALQAVPSHDSLIEDIKDSMRAEPTPVLATTPNPESGRSDRWVDISSAVIADTTSFTIKRLRYRRLVRVKDIDQSIPMISDHNSRYGNVYSAAHLTPALDVYDSHIEESFIEEPIVSMDETLIEAVERIIAQSGHGSKTTSACSSRSTSRKGGMRERSNSVSDTKATAHLAEVPRNECKKMVLSALEEIVREVAESRREGGDNEEKESFLREGVRSWLVNVETME
ncbi:hypothetical protein PVAG01_02833 [Phlyctema vagabunda]|uniref:Folliculin-interacting protein N-terminal domain-containing protein n=1 Tax=Phlyctema vagabunda TaxID=108571 RepID=A0ABR4PRQ1_9HELO